jgi:hypothetical protein
MKIVFTRGSKSAEFPLYGPCTLKIYEVPEAYSDDGLYAALWSPGELEPMPACGQTEAELLAHVDLAPDDSGTLALRKHFEVGEVRYAED